MKVPDSARNYWDVPNILLQKTPADEFMATTKVKFSPNPKLENEKAGLIIMGQSYAGIAFKSGSKGLKLVHLLCKNAKQGKPETEKELTSITQKEVYLRIRVQKGAICQFSYSLDGTTYTDAGAPFQAEAGLWIGAKIGLFATRTVQINDSGYADFDWFRVEPLY